MLYLALPILLQIICVVHAVRNGRVFPWIYIIVFLPLVGSIVYIAMEVVPDLLGSRGAHKIKTGVARTVDPNKDFRQAMREVEMVGSVDAKRALAEQLMQRGQYDEAVELYNSALQGHFRDDPVLWLGLARAQFLKGDGAAAQAALDELQKVDPKFGSADAHLLYARALELQGKDAEALAEYEKLTRYYPGEEARARYAQLLQKTGATEQSRSVFSQILKSLEGAPGHYRRAQKEWGTLAKSELRQ
ncbi:MAG TPA: tetratricopeptide repeat protein [Rhizomicrobium sp.]|jgi:hypothetical protein